MSFLLICQFLFSSMVVLPLWAGIPADYPVPSETNIRLFYLQRSSNSNTVVYDANVQSNGKLNAKRPVDVYWLRYNTNGKRKALNFAEQHFAYGLKFKSKKNGLAYAIELMAYAGREITISINQENKAVAETRINGKPAYLKSIYIDASGSGFWSTVNYIELVGVSVQDDKNIREQFDPNVNDEDED